MFVLCCVVLCCVVLCCVVLCCVVLCCVVLCCVMLCYVVLCRVVLCRRRCYQKAMAGMSTHGCVLVCCCTVGTCALSHLAGTVLPTPVHGHTGSKGPTAPCVLCCTISTLCAVPHCLVLLPVATPLPVRLPVPPPVLLPVPLLLPLPEPLPVLLPVPLPLHVCPCLCLCPGASHPMVCCISHIFVNCSGKRDAPAGGQCQGKH